MKIPFGNTDILVDSDGMPWRYYDGYFKSAWTVNNARILASRVEASNPEHSVRLVESRIRELGVTPEELALLDYGPWTIVTHRLPIDLDNAILS